MKKILVGIIICLFLGGCEGEVSGIRMTQNVLPDIVVCGGFAEMPNFMYCVDRNTGVVYLYGTVDRGGVMTVMMNADGSVVTAEQLGIKYD